MKDGFIEGVIASFLFGVVFVFYVLFHTFALMALWKWFIVPLNVPALGFMHALGIRFFLDYCFKNLHIYNVMSLEEEKHYDVIIWDLSLTSSLLFFGFIISFFV